MTIEQAFNLAAQHHHAGRLADAERLYRQVMTQQPDHADATNRLGVLACQAGRGDLGILLLERAVALKPDLPEAHFNLGVALQGQRRLDQAIAAFRGATVLRADYSQAWYNLGLALADSGALEEASLAYRQAIVLDPSRAPFHNNLSVVLRDVGRLDQAIAAAHRAIALDPHAPEAYGNLANALCDRGNLDEAMTASDRLIELSPRIPEAHFNAGNIWTRLGQLDQAIACFHRTTSLDPAFVRGHINLGNALKDSGQLDLALAAWRRAMALLPNQPEAHSNLVYSLHFHPGQDAQSLALVHEQWNRQHARPLRETWRPYTNVANATRRLRVGYVSADLREHPVGRFLLPLLKSHDQSAFEVFAYASPVAADAMTDRLAAHVDVWRDVARLSDAQVADQVRRDQIDILVDLTMHMARNRLLVFARRPAPVQVTYLAYCSTTGMDAIDYRLSDPYLDPPGDSRGAETLYAEKTVRLRSYWCFEPHVDTPPVGETPAAARGRITFGCLSNFCKVNESVLGVWGQVLESAPGSELLLFSPEGSHRQRVLTRLEEAGVAPSRVRFVGFAATAAYYQLYGQIDIVLDTFPYGGGTTTFDALWMGVPVVTLAGDLAVGRGGLSILTQLGLEELVGRSPEQYVRIASELAGDLPRLFSLRASLRQRLAQSPLMDAPAFARDVEAAFGRMWAAARGQ